MLNTRNQFFVLIALGIFSASVACAGPWTEAKTPAARDDAQAAVAVALDFVRACNDQRFDDAQAMMTAEHVRWKNAVGGVDAYFNKFVDAELGELFMYRTVTVDQDRVRIDVKIQSDTRPKGRNFRLNLIKSEGKWLLTHRNK